MKKYSWGIVANKGDKREVIGTFKSLPLARQFMNRDINWWCKTSNIEVINRTAMSAQVVSKEKGFTYSITKINLDPNRPTFRQILELMSPDDIDPAYHGGCCGCPYHYDFEDYDEGLCNGEIECSDDLCKKCWDREVK